MLQDRGLPINDLNKRIAKSKAWNRVEQGKISVAEFVEQYDSENRADEAAGRIGPALASISGIDVIAAIARVRAKPRQLFVRSIALLRKAGFKVVALTNNFKESSDTSALAKVVEPMFDVVIESSKVGFRKPGRSHHPSVRQSVLLWQS